MKFELVKNAELSIVLGLLKESAEFLQSKKLDQWSYWLNPPQERIDWITEGIKQHEFYFVKNESDVIIGMFRLLFEDELYWGKQNDKAGYVHSLVIKSEFKGNGFGNKIMKHIESLLIEKSISLFRLDCVANNQGLCNYYKNLGFKKVGEIQMPLSLNNLYEKTLVI